MKKMDIGAINRKGAIPGRVAYKRGEREKIWRKNNPDKVKAQHVKNHPEQSRKGGKYYDKHLEYRRTGLQGERNRIRKKHRRFYYPFKQIIAPASQLHHQWVPSTADYSAVALVETDRHMHGSIDVIRILEGQITLFTEAEIASQLTTTRELDAQRPTSEGLISALQYAFNLK